LVSTTSTMPSLLTSASSSSGALDEPDVVIASPNVPSPLPSRMVSGAS
jgi:hypothetical protein